MHAAQLEGPAGPKAEFAAQLLCDALAPTNFLPTNPVALVRAFETAGGSLVGGARNFLHDVVENHGWPSQVDRGAFEVGENLAVTPGKVVFRNELIELLQYEPQTEEVHEIPLLVCPPWINRYYIADLAPGKSLVEWAVQRGHTVFAVSYRNPDESMRELTFDDYLRLGPLSAIDVARSIGESETVNTLAICLGGTMNAMSLAYLDACGDHLVNSSTYLNSAIDYEGAGALAAVFADADTIEGLARRMEKTGYLDGQEIARTFDLLRANDLVFRYVVDGWLLGEKPPAFDLLAWNADSTNLPGKAHAHFTRQMYIENALARDAVRRDGRAAHDLRDLDRQLCRGRDRGSHRAVARVVPHDAALQGPDPLRPHVGRSHRRHREPAEPEGATLDEPRASRRSGTLDRRRDRAARHVVERLGRMDRRTRGSDAGAASDGERLVPCDR